jgi:hypothetical protein
MAKTYFLRFLIRNHADDLMVEVRKEEATRLRLMLEDGSTPPRTARFFVFDAVDGRSIAINLSDVQAVRFLWDPVALPPDTKRAEGAIQILLRGRENPLEEYPDSPEQVFALFANLDYGPEIVPYPSFDDADGEQFQLNANEIVSVVVPTHLLSEGARLAAIEDGLEDDA